MIHSFSGHSTFTASRNRLVKFSLLLPFLMCSSALASLLPYSLHPLHLYRRKPSSQYNLWVQLGYRSSISRVHPCSVVCVLVQQSGHQEFLSFMRCHHVTTISHLVQVNCPSSVARASPRFPFQVMRWPLNGVVHQSFLCLSM